MAGIAGLRGTGNWETDERPKNFRELILWRDPNGSAPLTALMAKMRKQTTDDPQFYWYEEELKPARVRISAAAATTTATSLTLAAADSDALDLVVGDLLMVEKLEVASTAYTFEIVEVSTAPAATGTLVVTRGAAGTTAATIATSSYLLKIGSAFEEGTTSPSATNRNPTKYHNFTQIFKTSYELSGTATETRLRTGDPISNDKKRRAFDHAVALENAMLFGNRSEGTGSGGKPKRYTAGLYYYLASAYDSTNTPTIKLLTSASTETNVLDALYQMWDYNIPESGDERIGFCGNGFLNMINKIAYTSSSNRSRVNWDAPVEAYGMKLTRWILPQGTVYLRTHPLMNVNSRFTNGCFIINPPGIRYRPLRNRDTKAMDNIQANDADSRKGQWLTECGAEFNHLRSMRYITFNES